LSIHPQALTIPAARLEIVRSSELTGVLAERFGVSTETIRKWRKRGEQDCQDHSSRPHSRPWKAKEEERVIAGYEVDCDDHQQGSGGERTGERHAGSG
jgi:uncharacterized protein YjcR